MTNELIKAANRIYLHDFSFSFVEIGRIAYDFSCMLECRKLEYSGVSDVQLQIMADKQKPLVS
jgi:hypothetical protein